MSADAVTPVAEQVTALSKAVITIDGARRVGWAKAFSAIRQLETVSCDFNIADTDRKLYREKFSFLWGFFRGYMDILGSPGAVATKEMLHQLGADSLTDLDSNGVLEPNHGFAGLQFARNIIDKSAKLADGDESADEVLRKLANRRLRKQARKHGPTVSDADERRFQAAKKRALYELAEEFGYPSIDELKSALRQGQRGGVAR